MRGSLSIGDFARATHLSVKTLRYYHQIGLLEPADVDQLTGHRRYSTSQVPLAQVIKRFRSLDMPLEEINAVVATTDLAKRNELISAHLRRLEENLSQTQDAVVSLRNLLQPQSTSTETAIEHRSVATVSAAAVREVIDAEDALSWYQGALGELNATLVAQKLHAAGPSGGIFANDLFTHERGEATIYIPCDRPVRAMGRVVPLEIPGAELAVIVHLGSHSEIDRAYGSLGSYVAEHALAVEGPIREFYVVGVLESADEAAWRTEIGWPIFPTHLPETFSSVS